MAARHPGTPDVNKGIATPEQGKKRVYSPNTVVSPTSAPNQEKKTRKNSIEIDEINPSPVEMEPDPETMPQQDLTMADLKSWMNKISNQLSETVKLENIKDLASKADLDTINDRITAQGTEINQIRDELNKCQQDITQLRTQFDLTTAQELDRKQGSAERGLGQVQGRDSTNMADNNNNSTRRTSTRRNLIFQGLKGNSEEEIVAAIISVALAIGVIMYSSDIESVLRLRNRDDTKTTPGPVLITLKRTLQRDMILKKKVHLQIVPNMNHIFINADEPIDVRRNKAILRKMAYNAKQLGDQVYFQHDKVTINGTLYTLDDLQNIPHKYRYEARPDNGANGASGTSKYINAMDCDETKRKSTPNPTVDLDAIKDKRRLFRDDGKICVCKSGIIFSGSTAYPSNMFSAPIKFNDKEYDSNEQAYQCDKAETHNEIDLAKKLKGMTSAREIKTKAGSIVTTAGWKQQAPGKLEKLFEKKMEDNPELLERLLDTYPLPLVEGCMDGRWGGGGTV